MPTRLTFRPATPADIPMLRDLAEHIWRASYAAMLSPAQIDYMLAWMYGAEAIAAEMQRGVLWSVAEHEKEPVGYLAISVAAAGGPAELHKLYLKPACQGSGLGQEMLQHVQILASAAGATDMRLRVNKTNARALRSYKRAGFRIVDSLVADIGGGYVMDDHVLSRPLGRTPIVKICGLSTPATLEAAIAAGADQIGLVFFPKSPRHVSLVQGRLLANAARGRAEIVALTVDATDQQLETIVDAVQPDWLQLHGHETPERAADVRHWAKRPVTKAIAVASRADVDKAEGFRNAADRLLFDAKPPKGAALPGGNGAAFDWTVLRGFDHPCMLSGGLTPDNVAEALSISGAGAVDVSSGVESGPGVKDPDKIAAFVRAARPCSGKTDA